MKWEYSSLSGPWPHNYSPIDAFLTLCFSLFCLEIGVVIPPRYLSTALRDMASSSADGMIVPGALGWVTMRDAKGTRKTRV